MAASPATRRPLFEFRLRDVAEIVPWGPPERPTLSWFGLTDGWFWMNVGDGELFRTRERPGERPSGFAYVDYQVVRLWEDVLELLPRAMAPVPSDIATRLESLEDWLAWFAGFRDRLAETASEVDADPYELAAKWATDRWLDTGYLVRGPRIFFWRTDDTMHVAWENRHRIDDDGSPTWSSAKGHVSMTIEDFVQEARDFNSRLMAAMAERIASVRTSWPHPGVMIDLVQLDDEQEQRSTWLTRALQAPAEEDWEAVREALRRFEDTNAAGSS